MELPAQRAVRLGPTMPSCGRQMGRASPKPSLSRGRGQLGALVCVWGHVLPGHQLPHLVRGSREVGAPMDQVLKRGVPIVLRMETAAGGLRWALSKRVTRKCRAVWTDSAA